MKTVVIAFDIDGTLRNTKTTEQYYENRMLLETLSKFKNVHIHLWSAGGEKYARYIAAEFQIEEFIDSYSEKNDTLKPDIAIDDLEDFSLGKINLIV